jgi:hypothetical protein
MHSRGVRVGICRIWVEWQGGHSTLGRQASSCCEEDNSSPIWRNREMRRKNEEEEEK